MTDAFMEKFIPATIIAVLACIGLAMICMLAAIAMGNGYVGMATVWFLGIASLIWIAMQIAVVVATSR